MNLRTRPSRLARLRRHDTADIIACALAAWVVVLALAGLSGITMIAARYVIALLATL